MCAYTYIKLLHGIFKNLFIPYSFVKADSVVTQFSVINGHKDRLSFWKCSVTRSMWGPRTMFPGEGSFISADDSSGRMTVNWPTWLWIWGHEGHWWAVQGLVETRYWVKWYKREWEDSVIPLGSSLYFLLNHEGEYSSLPWS